MPATSVIALPASLGRTRCLAGRQRSEAATPAGVAGQASARHAGGRRSGVPAAPRVDGQGLRRPQGQPGFAPRHIVGGKRFPRCVDFGTLLPTLSLASSRGASDSGGAGGFPRDWPRRGRGGRLARGESARRRRALPDARGRAARCARALRLSASGCAGSSARCPPRPPVGRRFPTTGMGLAGCSLRRRGAGEREGGRALRLERGCPAGAWPEARIASYPTGAAALAPAAFA